MKRTRIQLEMLVKTTIAMLCAGIALNSIDATAQGASKFDKSKLVGGWTLVSIENTLQDGKKMQGFGLSDGVVVFEPNGRFVQALARSDLPKFASNNRSTGTADENKAVVQGSLILFGTYSVADDGARNCDRDDIRSTCSVSRSGDDPARR